jgi:hypothetical protein
MAGVAGVLEGLVLIPVPGCARQLPAEVPVAELAIDGTRLIPITESVRARFQSSEQDGDKVAGFCELTKGITRWAEDLSRDWVVVYVHCEFWAGEGIHAAIAWRHGSIVFGPRFTRTRGEPGEAPYEAADRADMAINVALRAIGIQTEWPADEFATIGLDKHRWTSEWVT